MHNPVASALREWDIDGLLSKYDGLRIRPSPTDRTVIAGELSFRVVSPGGEVIEDAYDIELRVPPRFPSSVPTVLETTNRIPWNYHKLEGNALCLGAPTALRLRLAAAPSLVNFVDEFVVPYLAGYTHFTQTGRMLFGELAHGAEGIRQYLRELFGSDGARSPEEFVRLASLKKRSANKLPCPCDSGRRLGKCHNRIVNTHRRALGRAWFAAEYERVLDQLPARRNSDGRRNL